MISPTFPSKMPPLPGAHLAQWRACAWRRPRGFGAEADGSLGSLHGGKEATPNSLHSPNMAWPCMANVAKTIRNTPYPLVNQHSYWKLPFIVELPTKNGGSFHSYFSLPEGNFRHKWLVQGVRPWILIPHWALVSRGLFAAVPFILPLFLQGRPRRNHTI